MDRKATFTGANKVLMAFTAIYMVFQFILVIPAIIYGETFLESNIYGILLINQYIIVLLPVTIYTIRKRLDIKEVFRLRSPGALPSLLIILLSVPAFFTASMLNTILAYILQFIGDIPVTPLPVPGNLKELAQGLFVVCVSPAICEELLHRGIMLSGYERRGSLRAVAMTAFMFGIFHFDITNFLGPVFLGLLIGYYVVRTNSIFAGMIAHFANNALSEMIQYFFPSQAIRQEYLKISGQELGGAIFWGIVGIAASVVLVILFKLATEKRSDLKPPISSRRKDFIALISHWPVICVISLYVFIVLFSILSSILIKLSNG